MHSETDNDDGLERTTPINTLLQISHNRMNEIKVSYNAAKTGALHSITNNVGNPSTSYDVDVLYPDRLMDQSADIDSKYDRHPIMFRRMVCSEDVTKKRLCLRDNNTQTAFDRANIEAKEDESFFENLKRRISNDIKNKPFNKIEVPTPRRSSIVKKRKSAFNNESLNLMKKCRAQNIGRPDKSSSSTDNGIYSLENKHNNENQENIVMHKIVNESESFLMPKKNASNILIPDPDNFPDNPLNRKEDDDDESRCVTPFSVKPVDDILST